MRQQDQSSMSKCRIIERTHPSGRKEWMIQQKHWLLRWRWVDASANSSLGKDGPIDHFRTFEEAKASLWMFDGSKPTDKIVWP